MYMPNWHLVKATPAALLVCHIPCTNVYLTAPGQGKGLPFAQHHTSFIQKKVLSMGWQLMHNHKHLGPAESASTVKTTCWWRCWNLHHKRACASRKPKQALVHSEETGQGQSRYCHSVEGQIFLSDVCGGFLFDFIILLLLLLLINTYNILIENFAMWFS